MKYSALWHAAVKEVGRHKAGVNLRTEGVPYDAVLGGARRQLVRKATALELARRIVLLRKIRDAHRWGSWHTQGGSVYSGCSGKYGNLCGSRLGIAELQMGSAMGGLPGGSKLQLRLPGGSPLVVYLLDIGGGGPPVYGLTRAVDVHCRTLNAMGVGDCENWTGRVQWRRLR